MRASEIISRLSILIKEHGDLDVEISDPFHGLIEMGKINYYMDKQEAHKPETFILIGK